MRQPAYFKSIRAGASKRWDQLERDQELAGPWHQLFRQVQSPRHVVSELLQNADDAGATEAAVEIDDGEFIFSHNGDDFSEEQFASLCRFGYSNKRTLHTIGFRGVGFKSTFSLGDEVRLVSPTLSVAFHRERFTEPRWVDSADPTDGRTEIRVVIQSKQVQEELGKNLREWSESPASLLFFNNIRCLRLDDREIRWESQGTGPIAGSEWMSVSNTPGNQYLVVRSSEEEFPDDALTEIKEERMPPDDGTTFPPCRVEIVLGLKGRLYVVLPTGVMTDLPFACNAPFIQDPARMKIKDPVLSPTNGWLLKRAGELAADAMLALVRTKSLPIEERCQAYGFLPDVDREDRTIEGSCGTIVEESFDARIASTKFLLTETKSLESSGRCLAVPSELLDVWSPTQITADFSTGNLPILSRHISERDRKKLTGRKHIRTLSKSQVLETLKNNRLPRPRTWRQLLRLWEYLSDEIIRLRSYHGDLRIVPAQGKEVLYAANEVVRIGQRRSLKPEDWEFLSPFLLTLDPNWTRFLAEGRRAAGTASDEALEAQVQVAFRCIAALGLSDPTDADRILSKVADAFFAPGSRHDIQDYVRLTHIAAKLGSTVPESFRFVTQSQGLARGPILADIDNDLDMFVDADWYEMNVLQDAYANPSETCTHDEWRQWVLSPSSRLHAFVPLTQTSVRIKGRERLKERLRLRGFEEEPSFRYRSDDFELEDWNFASRHWDHWKSLAVDDDKFWSTLFGRILEQPSSYWSGATSARAIQVARNGYFRPVTQQPLVPNWIIRFRDLPCLTDTWGQPHQPAEIFRRTPATEPLLGVEPFVKADLDTEATRPLLILLGVRDKPTGPERILERLLALAGSNTPLLPEVQKWCHSLDQLFDRCSTGEVQEIKTAFASKRLILNDQGEWAKTDEVFLNSDEDDLSEAVLIHPSLRALAIWRKIGVPERPTADMEIEWLRGLPSSGKLSDAQTRRIRRLLPVYPGRIWNETGHWLNLEGHWVPVESLAHSLTMQSLVPWSHLFPPIKAATADFRPLPSETCQSHPFSSLPRLGDVVEERFQGQTGLPEPLAKQWMISLGKGLGRIILDDSEHTERVRNVARQLEHTRWQVAGDIKSVPYIDGKPAGTSRTIEVSWQGHILYVQNSSLAKMAKAVPLEIGRAFDRQDIADAIKICYERDEDFIDEYLDSSFDLADAEEVELVTSTGEKEQPEVGKDIADPSINLSPTGNQPPEEDSPATDEDDGQDEPSPRPPRQPRQPQPSFMERFAEAKGFSLNGTGRFYHSEGSWLERTSGNPFPWELRSASGEIVQYYWPKEHCIRQAPLQLEAEIWDLCQQSPGLYSLILSNINGVPVEVPGGQLVKLREQEKLVLYPATYRLVYNDADG